MGWTGSANFTERGMAGNVELTLQIEDARAVSAMWRWFNARWKELEANTEEVFEA